MQLKDKNILLISPENWGEVFVSKHHYATHLAKRRNKVFFLNPPSNEYRIDATKYPNVWSVQYKGFIKGLRFFPSLFQQILVKKELEVLEEKCGVVFDILWSFDNSVFYSLKSLPSSILKISHIVDLNQDFQTKKAAKSADFCFCTTESIYQRLKKYNSRTFKVNHGVLYNESLENTNTALPGKNKVKAAYVGNLSMHYLDWELLYEVSSHYTHVDFIFIGPEGKSNLSKTGGVNKWREKVKKQDNCFFLPPVRATDIPVFLKAADLLLICYQEKYHREQANPHKMMEYLLSGKTVVCTYTAEYKDLSKRGLISMCERNKSFKLVFEAILVGLADWNAVIKQKQRQEYALSHTYDMQIKRIESLINSTE